MRISLLLYIFILNSLFTFSFAQDDNYLKKEQKILSSINDLEEKYNVNFFYDTTILKEIKNLSFKSTGNLELDLKTFLKESDVKYFIYKKIYVFLTIESIDLTSRNYIITSNQSNSINEIDYDALKIEENIIHTIGFKGNSSKLNTLTGNVKEYISKQNLEGVAVLLDEGAIGTTTDKNGNFKLYITQGYHILTFQHLGFSPTIRKINIYSDGNLNVSMIVQNNLLDEIVFVSNNQQHKSERTGFEYIEMKKIKSLPSLLGETDIIKYSLLLPGIHSAGEADMSFNVRGGKGDQNLILLDGMHTYSYSHFFGFFPGMSPESINKSKLYKSSIPVEFGSRISSVYDIKISKGSFNKYNLNGGISPVSANIMLNGPIIKNKLSFLAGFRSTYSNWLLNYLNTEKLEKSSVNFHDYHFKLNFQPKDNSHFSLFAYNSFDEFSFHIDTSFNFRNQVASFNWHQNLKNDNLFDLILGYSSYQNSIKETPSIENSIEKRHSINDLKINSFFTINHQLHKFKTGFDLLYHNITPWSLYKYDEKSNIIPQKMSSDNAIEATVFFGDNFKVWQNKIILNLGVRYVMYSLVGEKVQYEYSGNETIEENIIDTVLNSKFLNNFDHGLDYRISANIKLGNKQNLNLSYDRNRQYVHVLSNTQSASPYDSWQLSNKYIKPQIGNQLSIGYNRNSASNIYSGSVELYYKQTKNLIDFINGSEFNFNSHPETEITNSLGRSYGIELLLSKTDGRFNGFISYTFSRSLIKSNSQNTEKLINNGEYYSSSFDKPHNISAIINYEPTKRFVISNIINYSSGAPITLPVAKMEINGSNAIIYSERNEYRLPDYFRWDISITFKGSLKKHKILSGNLMLSIFNLTGRKNIYSVYYQKENNDIQGYKLSILGSTIPTITYKFNL